jgi:LysM domain-containing protein
MASRSWSGLVAVALLLLGATVAAASDQPPANLHKVGDHWTAWDPPTEFPAGAQTYTIVSGDTLWDLAGKYLKNPYLWPQLWEKNQYIKDAHWIYPGDPLLISLEAAPVEQLSEQDLGGKANEGEPTGADGTPLNVNTAAAPLQPLGSEDDIYCSGYVGDMDEQFGYHIIGSEYNGLSPRLGGTAIADAAMSGIYGDESVKYNLSVGDIVYVDGGMAAGLSPGIVYSVVHPRDVVKNPVTHDIVGRLYQYQGRVRLLTVQDNLAIAEIVQACDGILAGSALKPFVPEPVPLGRRSGLRSPNAPVAASALDDDAVILRAKDDIVSLGNDHVVFVNLSADSGVAPGDLYTIYRYNQPGLPPIVVGELAVLSVHPRGSVARIIASRYPIYIGDRLEPK